MTSATPPSRLDRFLAAQQSLYGPNLYSIPDPQTWTPPPNSGGHKGRYLWTDAFGVLNFITLHRETSRHNDDNNNNNPYLTLARRLVHTVHDILGRTRNTNNPTRLPGATETNPLGGGLRIGKQEEHGPDGDGQYHHYLTLWMFALNRLSLATGDAAYNHQAVSLARAIHPKFVLHRESARPRMVWKMAADLSRPLVSSEGNLDPLDGFVVFRLLQAAEGQAGGRPVLEDEIEDYRRVMARKGSHFVSSDPLDLGMSMWTAHWFVEKEAWATRLAEQCFEQIYELFELDNYLNRSIQRRLAFREFGTGLGLQCMAGQSSEKDRAVDLTKYAQAILDAWNPYMRVSSESSTTPEDLRPITRVMYAAALIPGAFQRGYLGQEPSGLPEQ
ncbi:hypothetical protein P168DRAFT_236865 [Aspergillus campestris IBT 28561]|uniref:Uncharacterized protein n=1 Tax=Aspergillus campestris (strain IBT 28561) TaxID=1392248 RepID=A0A2I1D2Y0_ASPC2|nr:uncharacterized protein P168DRAFT_236865 [Aspergillus campestris IBT 28561]PKY04236.1 hypothetical protein P168DRAFT_236865 [Aspergillus campestris IBT 28561]